MKLVIVRRFFLRQQHFPCNSWRMTVHTKISHTHNQKPTHTVHTSMYAYTVCVYTESPNFFCLQKLWILWGLERLVGFLSGFFRMSSARLDFLLTFKITDCGACRLPRNLLFFRRYGQKVGPAAVSIGYWAILKQSQNPANSLLCWPPG